MASLWMVTELLLPIWTPLWPGVFASVASNNPLLLVGGTPVAYNGTHTPAFKARMTRVRALLARDSTSVAYNHFFWMKAAHSDLWPRLSIS